MPVLLLRCVVFVSVVKRHKRGGDFPKKRFNRIDNFGTRIMMMTGKLF